jgi:hypothetical protein
MSEADEEPLQIVGAGLFDLGSIDMDITEEEFFIGHQSVEVEPEGAEVFSQVSGLLLE